MRDFDKCSVDASICLRRCNTWAATRGFLGVSRATAYFARFSSHWSCLEAWVTVRPSYYLLLRFYGNTGVGDGTPANIFTKPEGLAMYILQQQS